MSTVYRILYHLGFTPPEHEPPEPLADLIEGPHSLPHSHMLDIGCGTGHDASYAARHGWTVTGVDAIPRAAMPELRAGYALLLDSGCLHGLTPAQRQRAAAMMTGAAESGATLLIFAFAPGHRRPGPRGIDPAQVAALFPQWDPATSRPASEVALRGAIHNGKPS